MFLLGFALVIASLVIAGLARSILRLKALKHSVDHHWKQLASHLQRRYKRLPQLFEEMGPLPKLRSSALQSIGQTSEQANQFLKVLCDVGGPLITDMSPLLDAETRLVSQIKEMMSALDNLLAADHPTLRHRMFEISQLESRTLLARQQFNSAVASYNYLQRTKPAIWMLKWGQHSRVALYQIAPI